MINNSKLTFVIFILIILGLMGGGYYLIDKKNSKENNEEIITDKRIDKNKEFIYYDDIEIISKEASLAYKNIHINLESDELKNLENKLNSDMNSIRGTYKKIPEELEKEIINPADDIYEAPIIEYNIYETTDYLTIEVNKYTFYATNEDFANELSYYVISKKHAKLLNDQEIIKNENLNSDLIRSQIYDYIKNIEDIDLDVTMNNAYTLYYGENGKVKANIIVKIGDITYNDNVQIN